MSFASRRELLRRGLELGEVVRVALHQVADLLAREVASIDAGHLLAVGEPRREVVRAGARGLVGAVEREDGARGDGARGGHLAHVDRGEVALLEHRVGEGLGEIGDEPRVLVGRERVDVDVEQLREADEERSPGAAAGCSR